MSRIGVMMAVLAILLMSFVTYLYATCVAASDAANQEAEGLAETLARIYSGPVGIETTYFLPAEIGGHEYDLRVINDSRKGLVVGLRGTRCESCVGGAPFNARIAGYPATLKDASEEKVSLVVKNLENGVSIRRLDPCCQCIIIEEFHYDAQDDCNNLNSEYVTFKNRCSHACDVTGWTVKDELDSRKPYEFPGRVIDAGGAVKLHSGCGSDDYAEAYWCSSGYPCNAVWNNEGDTLYLRESGGYVCLEYKYA